MIRKTDTVWPQAPAAAVPAGMESETSVPARPASFTADVIVPAAQAIITGALTGAVVTFAAVALGYQGKWPALFAAVALGISAVAWLVLLGQTRRLLWAVERMTGLDLDRDGAQGKPQERVVIVNAERSQQEQARREASDRASKFAQFVAALPVKGTAARTWEQVLTRSVYQEYRDALIRLGWARWLSVDGDGRPNERRGWELTLAADDILRRISG